MADTRFQTQVRTQSRAEIDQGLRSYMLGVYNYMALGVAATAVIIAAATSRRRYAVVHHRVRGFRYRFRVVGSKHPTCCTPRDEQRPGESNGCPGPVIKTGLGFSFSLTQIE